MEKSVSEAVNKHKKCINYGTIRNTNSNHHKVRIIFLKEMGVIIIEEFAPKQQSMLLSSKICVLYIM